MGTKNIYQPLGEAYSLIDEMVRTLPRAVAMSLVRHVT